MTFFKKFFHFNNLLSFEFKTKINYQTSKTAFIQPSFSGLFVIYAYLLNTTLPVYVTNPNSVTLTSITVPFVNTPKLV